MRKILLIAVLLMGITSCSNDDDQSRSTKATQLEIALKKCADEFINSQNSKGVPPPGLGLCDCVDLATQEYNNTK